MISIDRMVNSNCALAHKVVVWRRSYSEELQRDICLPYLKYGEELFPYAPAIWTTDLEPEDTPLYQRGRLVRQKGRLCLLY